MGPGTETDRTTLSAALILLSLPAQAETPTEWIELGARAARYRMNK
jgi:hypothetical protein